MTSNWRFIKIFYYVYVGNFSIKMFLKVKYLSILLDYILLYIILKYWIIFSYIIQEEWVV